MGIDVIRTGAAVGAEIRGVDLSRDLDDGDFDAIDNAYNENGVIFFREQSITPDRLLALTQRFGDLQLNTFGETLGLPDFPGIVLVSNVEEDGREIGIKRAGENWHSDMCYTPKPPRGTILYAQEVPEIDGLTLGDTCFAATHAAYDSTSRHGCARCRLRRRRSRPFLRSPIRSSERTLTRAGNAFMSCGTTARGSSASTTAKRSG
jgi:taurine dioxygenase